MRNTIFGTALTTAIFVFIGNTARADVAFHLQAGYGVGYLDVGEASLAYGPHYAFDVEYLLKLSERWLLVTGATGLYGELLFEYDGVNNQATLTAGGLNLGLASRSAGGFVTQVSGVYFPHATMVYTNSTSSKVNDRTYKHSSLVTLTGAAPVEVRLSFINETMTGQFSKHERMRTGLVVGYETQTYTNRSIKLDTNSVDLEPSTTLTKDELDASLSALTLRFLVGIAF